MYLKSLVKVPNAPGKLLRQKKADTTYVYYEIDRIYIPEKKNTRPKRVVIGKLSKKDPDMMQPNEIFLSFKVSSSCGNCILLFYHVLRKMSIKTKFPDNSAADIREQGNYFIAANACFRVPAGIISIL